MKKFFLVVSLLCASCAHKGFQRDEMRAQLEAPPQISEAEIERELAKRPQLPQPFRLGIYFREPEMRGVEGGFWKRWTEAERARIFGLVNEIQSAEVRSVTVIQPELVGATDLKGIRRAAARYGVDAVLIIGGAGEVVTNENALASTYLLLFPMLFAPGTDVAALFLTHASLWDVRNEYLYLDATGEAEVKKTQALAMVDEQEILLEAKAASLESFRRELKDRLVSFLGNARAAEKLANSGAGVGGAAN